MDLTNTANHGKNPNKESKRQLFCIVLKYRYCCLGCSTSGFRSQGLGGGLECCVLSWEFYEELAPNSIHRKPDLVFRLGV